MTLSVLQVKFFQSFKSTQANHRFHLGKSSCIIKNPHRHSLLSLSDQPRSRRSLNH